MPRYVKTNLRFEQATYAELKLRAAREGVPIADLVRGAVERYLGRAGDGSEASSFGEDPADWLVGCLQAGVGDESDEHDAYLYGWPRETDKGASPTSG